MIQGTIPQIHSIIGSVLLKLMSFLCLVFTLLWMVVNEEKLFVYINFIKGKVPFAKVGFLGLNGFANRGIYFVVTFLLIACILNLVPKRENIFSFLGKYTLPVYMIHPMILTWIFIINDGESIIRNGFPETATIAMLFAAAILTILLALSGALKDILREDCF